MPGIRKQNAAQIDGRGGRVDRSMKPLLHQPGNPAGMIKMRVSKDDGIDGTGRHRQILPVALAPFFLTLKQATVDEHLQAARAAIVKMNQVLCFFNDAGGTEKLEV